MQSSEPVPPSEPVTASTPRAGVVSRGASWFWRGAELRAVQARIAAEDPTLSNGLACAGPLLRQIANLRDLHENEAALACAKEAVRVLIHARFGYSVEGLTEQDEEALQQLCADPDLATQALGLLRELEGPVVGAEQRTRAAAVVHQFALAVYDALSADRLEKGRILAGRIWRIGALTVLLALLTLAVSLGLMRWLAPPDLAPGASWRASSTYAGFDLKAGTCDGVATDVFFHTQQEQDPYIEYDLKAVKQIRRIDVSNRSDCCQERAVPLIVEVSTDRKQWQEVARRPETFRSVKLSFEPTQARYVRLRANENTWLHLEKVAIRGE